MRLTALVSILTILLTTAQARSADWPQFRGPNCTGISLDSAALPTTFTDTENVLWSANLGDGIGCPIVAAGRVSFHR